MSVTGWIHRLRHSAPVNQIRYHLYRDVLLAWPKRHECNLCGWRGRHFLTFVHRRVLCPRCGSQVRHRLIAAAITHRDDVRSFTRLDGVVLHMSPEYCLVQRLRPLAARYVRADYAADDRDIFLDITDMRGIDDETFDVVIACDVLEHIEDEQAALREIRRVLRDGGTAILTVPQFDGDEPTLEDPTARTPEARQALFGQFDHVRNYGADFPQRLSDAGFAVTEVHAGHFDSALAKRHVLAPGEPIESSVGWNRRRIHFARRIPGNAGQ